MCLVCQISQKINPNQKNYYYSQKKLKRKYKLMTELDCDNCKVLKEIPKNISEFFPNLRALYCSWCPNIEKIPIIQGLKVLILNSSPKIYFIPKISSLEYLQCRRNLVSEIPVLENLKKLFVCECLNLENIPNIPGLMDLYCLNCPLIKTIPKLKNLTYLDIEKIYIRELPIFKNLKTFWCMNCPELKEIPKINSLNNLYCNYNESLKKISNLKNLKYLELENCKSLEDLPNFYNLKKIYRFGYCKSIVFYDKENFENLLPDHLKKKFISEGLEKLYSQNLHNYRLKQSKEFIDTILEELIKVTWEPNRAKDWCWDTEEKIFLGLE
jgi:hypothetical protein